MSLNTNAILDLIVSHAASLGFFDTVNTHEPKNPPGRGITASIWFESQRPVITSGLNSTSVQMEWNIRLQTSSITEPADLIDTNLIDAMDALLDAYNGDFSLGGLVRQVDVFGSAGHPLQSKSSYLEQGGSQYRLIDITLPIIINDVWDQES